MKLLSLKIQNKDKFLKGIKINFTANNKRKDNMSQIKDGIINYVSIFGRNASGKTSIMNNVITYFANIDKETLKNREVNNSSYSSPTQITQNWLDLAFSLPSAPAKSTFDKIIEEQMSFNPKYIAEFKLNSGKVIKHTMKIRKTSSIQTSFENLEIDGVFHGIKNQNMSGGSSLLHDFNLKSLYQNENGLTLDETTEFSGYVKNTLQNIYISDTNWSKNIASIWKEWIKNSEIEKKKTFLYYAQKLDKNFLGIFHDATDDSFFAKIRVMKDVKEISISKLSAGTRSTMLYFARLINIGSDKFGGLMIQDEIEARVHEEVVKDMVDAIEHYDLNTQILFTSHSPKTFDKWFRHDATNFIQNIDNVIDLHNVADKYKTRPDKLISTIFSSKDYLSPGEIVW